MNNSSGGATSIAFQRQSGPVYELDGVRPEIAADVFIAPNAAVIGNVRIEAGASVWFGAVVRGDDMPILIGSATNIQDGAVIHATEEVSGVTLGSQVVVGHGAILHGCSVGDGALIGIGAIILDGAVVGARAIVAAGALVPPRKVVPPGCLWVGNPGVVRRPISQDEMDFLTYAPTHYARRARQYLENGIL